MAADWTIGIVTVGARGPEFARLVADLAPQLHRAEGRVQALVHWDNFETSLGEARQRVLDAVDTEYISFVDDDDRLPPYHVSRVLSALDLEPDYVGWRMQLYWDGVPTKPTFHSLQYDRWWDDDAGYYRNVSHLNPIRTSLARLGRFDRNVPEDVDWARQVHEAMPADSSEVFLSDVLYEYFYRPSESLWSRTDAEKARLANVERPALSSPFMRYL